MRREESNVGELEDLADRVGELAGHMQLVGDSLDAIREDLNWLTRNPLRVEVQAQERRAADADWGSDSAIDDRDEVSSAVTAAELEQPALPSTGSWLKLGQHYFEVNRFERSGSSTIQIEIETHDSQDEAALGRLRPDPQGFRGRDPLPFAFQNEGGFVKVGDVTSVSHGDGNLWSIELDIEEPQSGYPMDVTHNFGGNTTRPTTLPN